jgi:hypothetical protein
MTPANAPKNTSVTPGTEAEVEDCRSVALNNLAAIEVFLSGSRVLIDRALENQGVFVKKEDVLFTHALALIGHALEQVDNTQRLLDNAIVQNWEANKSQGGAA